MALQRERSFGCLPLCLSGEDPFLPSGGSWVFVPVLLGKDAFGLSLFKASSHTCPLRMAVRVRPLACLRYSESFWVVAALLLRQFFSLR